MEYLLELIGTLVGDESQRKTAFLALTALSMFTLTAALAFLIASLTDPVRRRLATISGPATSSRQALRAPGTQGNLSRMLDPVADYVLPSKELERDTTRSKLVHAGYRHPSALTTFYAIKTLLAIALPLGTLVATRWFPELSVQSIFLLVAVAAFAGVAAPNACLEKRVAARQRLLRDGFPDALDLLVVCVESGLGLTAAIQRVADDLDVSHPELADELSQVGTEIRLGIPRMEALKSLAERTGLEELQSLVVLLDQSARFGTSIADTLRVYAEEFRDKRMQAAEEVAAKIGTKMIFPLTFCIWPSFFLVAVGPAVLKAMEAFRNM